MIKTIVSLFAFGAVLSAAPVTVSFVDPGTPAVAAYGFYVGPYTLNVNGTNVKAMCMDDFLQVGGTWSANQTAATSSDLSNTYLGSGGKNILGQNFTSSQVYTAEAYLFSQITNPNADRGNIQEAAWAIMDTNTLNNVINSNNTAVINILSDVASNFSSFDASGYSIISQSGPHDEQEFMTASAPEPASFALFGGGLLAAGLARFPRRRKAENS